MTSLNFILATLFAVVLLCQRTRTVQAAYPPTKLPIEDKAILTQGNNPISQDPGPEYRLPGSLIPQNYVLQIRPIIDKDYPGIGLKNTAPGFVRLTATCVEPTNRVVLHQKFLTIDEPTIEVKAVQSGASIQVTSVEYDEPKDFLILNLQSSLTQNEDYQVSMEYTANVPPNDTLRGLYSEAYLDPKTNQTKFGTFYNNLNPMNNSKVMAVTQLEPVRARQVLPCMDEPTYKATFDVIIGRTENFTALGNGPLILTEPDVSNPGWFWDTFNRTVNMPSYLLAMGVSEYSYSEAPTSLYRLPVRVYGPRHLVEEGLAQLTANSSAILMQHFEQKYGIPYNMPKVDSISVPYKRGAMENYGLITYGEYYLMYYEGTTLSTELRGIYNILAHELGHQWFGNLVTCKWWSDIWLNEGFASYVSYAAMDEIWPEFEMLNYMVHDAVNVALQFDATSSSHPIHQEAYDAEQIGNNMDTIGYDKGASVIRMMVSFLGEEAFYNGIKQYLAKLVAEQDDLFEELNSAANGAGLDLPKTVAEIMNTWTLQTGFPLVRVSKDGQGSVKFTQETWQNADVRNGSNPGTSWNIPITTSLQTETGATTVSFWILQDDDSVSVPLPNNTSSVLVNTDAGGYYRTIYDEELSNSLIQELQANPNVFSAAARLRLLDDQFHLAFQDYSEIESALEFTKYLAAETDNSVWTSVLGNLLKIRTLFHRDMQTQFKALQGYLLPKVESALESLSKTRKYQAPHSAVAILESQLVDWSCALSSSWCNSYANTVLSEWANSQENSVPTDLQQVLYCKTVEVGGGSVGTGLAFARYLATYDKVQKSRLASALACARDPNVYSTLHEIITDPEGDTDTAKVYSILIYQRMIMNPASRDFITTLLSENLQKLIDLYDGNVNSVLEIISPAALYFSSEQELNWIENFGRDNADVFQGALNSTLVAVRQNVEWMAKFDARLTTWFEANSN